MRPRCGTALTMCRLCQPTGRPSSTERSQLFHHQRRNDHDFVTPPVVGPIAGTDDPRRANTAGPFPGLTRYSIPTSLEFACACGCAHSVRPLAAKAAELEDRVQLDSVGRDTGLPVLEFEERDTGDLRSRTNTRSAHPKPLAASRRSPLLTREEGVPLAAKVVNMERSGEERQRKRSGCAGSPTPTRDPRGGEREHLARLPTIYARRDDLVGAVRASTDVLHVLAVGRPARKRVAAVRPF